MPNASNHYQKFYVQQNKLSVYSETAASKRREECAKQQRIELEEKFKHNQYILKQFRSGNGNIHYLILCFGLTKILNFWYPGLKILSNARCFLTLYDFGN